MFERVTLQGCNDKYVAMSEEPIVISTIDKNSVVTQSITVTYTLLTKIDIHNIPKRSYLQSRAIHKRKEKNRTFNPNLDIPKYYLDPSVHKLLVPQPVPLRKMGLYPPIRGGPAEYLVVDSTLIGPECQKAGVSFRSFAQARGKHKINRKGCLINQPLQFWKHDKDFEKSNKTGKYFLKYFGYLAGQNTFTNTTLNLKFTGALQYSLNGDVRADFNGIIRVGTSNLISQILVDASCPLVTVLSVTVYNLGLSSASYRMRVTDCGPGLPYLWSNLESTCFLIPPQKSHKFTVRVPGPAHSKVPGTLFCSVEILNARREIVSARRMKILQMARCFCEWHCLCVCVMNVGALPKVRALRCEDMSPSHMHICGMEGLPSEQYMTRFLAMQYIILDVIIFISTILLILLILGLAKAIIGFICCSEVGAWGIDMIRSKPKPMTEYLEEKFKSRVVKYNTRGYPVHPDTRKRTIRTFSHTGQFLLNLIFFIIYPFIGLCCHIRHWMCNRAVQECETECWENRITTREPSWSCDKDEDDELQRLLENNDVDCDTSGRLRGAGYDENKRLEYQKKKEEIRAEKTVMLQLKKSHETLLENGIDVLCRSSGVNLNNMVKQKVNKKEMNDAQYLINSMLETRVVYRTLKKSLGGALVAKNKVYCVRGYFLRTLIGLTFITPTPMLQHWEILSNGKLRQLIPPRVLMSPEFTSEYKNGLQVIRSGDLSLSPLFSCINSKNQIKPKQKRSKK